MSYDNFLWYSLKTHTNLDCKQFPIPSSCVPTFWNLTKAIVMDLLVQKLWIQYSIPDDRIIIRHAHLSSYIIIMNTRSPIVFFKPLTTLPMSMYNCFSRNFFICLLMTRRDTIQLLELQCHTTFVIIHNQVWRHMINHLMVLKNRNYYLTVLKKRNHHYSLISIYHNIPLLLKLLRLQLIWGT